jgi:hypothetical protein
MNTAQPEPAIPPADRAVAGAHAEALRDLAAKHGITFLRFASSGRLVGHIAEDRDSIDVGEFELAAVQLLGAEVRLFSDAVLSKENVSPDLVAAEPL